MSKQWAAIPFALGYEVSSCGDVVSLRRNRRYLVKHSIDQGGYHRVALYVGGKRRYYAVHRLVLIVFVGACPPGCECLHEDDDKNNNTLQNLSWGTRVQNCLDRRRNGIIVQGTTNGRSKLTERLVVLMRRRRLEGASYPKLATEFGVSNPTAYHACKGNTWKHVKEYL